MSTYRMDNLMLLNTQISVEVEVNSPETILKSVIPLLEL